MERLRYSVDINAPRAKVWEMMLADETYRDWTSAFTPGSHYVGDWSKGSKILFLGPDKEGESGMVARVKDVRPQEYLSIEHLGVVTDGKEETASEAAAGWAGAQENYSLTEIDGRTEVQVEVDVDEPYRQTFEEAWPKALQRLKTLAEH